MSDLFYTPINRPVRRTSPVGSRMKKNYQLETDPDGRKILVETGVTDVYECIQSYKNECLIENIVKRHLAGDPTALAKTQGVYCDTTLIPKDLISAHEAVKQAESIYKRMPADIRGQYASFKEFVNNFGSLENIQKFYDSLNTKGKAKSDPDKPIEGGAE